MEKQDVLEYSPSSSHVYNDRSLVWCGSVAYVLFVASAIVVATGAADSPYHQPIVVSEAVVQVGIGSLLICGWVLWSAFLLRRIKQKQISSYLSVATLLPAVAVFFLYVGDEGYIKDVHTNKFVPATMATSQPVSPTLPSNGP